MAYSGFAGLRDDFVDNSVASAWATYTIGSATVAETGGQAVVTLPSSTAGSHEAGYYTPAPYNLTSDSFYITIGTMVATGVAATAFYDLRLTIGAGTGLNLLRWRQVSNTITARHVVNGTDTQVYTATWSSTTYKYLRIRADTTTVYWDSSSNGTSWTNRASVAISSLFPITDLFAQFGAACGNIASPGSFKLDDVNLILPALTTNWRWTQALEALTERIMPITLALDTAGTAQGYIATADGVDVNGDPSGTIQYWSGPAKQGRELTLCASQAQAQAMAVNIPVDGRFDLPTLVECKCIRLYHRSVDGSAYTLREFYPRRVVEADDVRAENIQALHIATGTITADKLNALLVISNTISTAYNGARVTLSGDTFGGIIGYGATDTYDPSAGTGTYQILWDKTDGKFYAGGGSVILDDDGIILDNTTASQTVAGTLKFTRSLATRAQLYYYDDATSSIFNIEAPGVTSRATSIGVSGFSPTSGGHAAASLVAQYISTQARVTADYNNGATTIQIHADSATVDGGLNVGTATGATTGSIKASGDFQLDGHGGIGVAPSASHQLYLSSGAGVAMRIDGSGNIATSATAGSGSALPATPQGYLIVNIAGTSRKIPYFVV